MPSGQELMAAAAYFRHRHTIGSRDVNLDLLKAFAQMAAAVDRMPWLLRADFNMEPWTISELG